MGALADNGDQGLDQQVRAIHLTRAPPERRLSSDDERDNDKKSRNRAVYEN